MFVFFHQNDVTDAQGGIERYVDTLLTAAGPDGLLVSPPPARPSPNRLGLRLRRICGPKWVPFACAVICAAATIRARLRGVHPLALEFSRPEYVVFAWMFPGSKTFTIHGTGPGAGETCKRLVHDIACWFLPFVADRVQVVGRDPSGLSAGVRRRLGTRLAAIDAWYADRFAATPFPPTQKTIVFYAGRIVAQKNPDLLFEIFRKGKERFGDAIEFRYFGKDVERIREAGLESLVTCTGLLDAPALADAIAACHMGLMCSHFGEGSPFIVVETLACGRPYVLSSLPTLTGAYGATLGVRFAPSYDADAFLDTIVATEQDIDGGLDAEAIRAGVADRTEPVATRRLLATLAGLRAGERGTP